MVSPFSGYVTTDGKPFEREIDAIRHEARLDLAKSFPELKGPQHDGGAFDRLADILTNYVLRREMDRVADNTTLEAQPPGDHPWPEAVRTAMNTDNLGEVYATGRCHPDAHDWRPSGDSMGLIDRCATCGEERA